MPRISVKVCQALLTLVAAFLGAACEQGPLEESPAWPPKARWHNNQGVVYMDQHNYTRGREEFARALALAPDYASAQANLGIAYYALGKYDSAATALQAALAIDPDLLHANYALGLIYNAQGREHDKALAALQKVAAVDRDDPHVRYYMGQMRAKLNEGEAALADFKEAIRLDPYNVSAYYGMANLYRRLGREEEWKSTLEHFNQLSQAGHQGVSSSYQGQGKYAEAVADAGGGDPSRDDVAGPFAFAAAGPATGSVRFAALGDFDADGRPDVLAGAEGLAPICWWHRGSAHCSDASRRLWGDWRDLRRPRQRRDRRLGAQRRGRNPALPSGQRPMGRRRRPVRGLDPVSRWAMPTTTATSICCCSARASRCWPTTARPASPPRANQPVRLRLTALHFLTSTTTAMWIWSSYRLRACKSTPTIATAHSRKSPLP